MTLNNLHSSIVVKGHQIDLGEALPEHVREKLSQAAEKSFGSLRHAAVGFSREGQAYRCTINAQVGNLKVIIGEAPAADCYRALRGARESSRTGPTAEGAAEAQPARAHCRRLAANRDGGRRPPIAKPARLRDFRSDRHCASTTSCPSAAQAADFHPRPALTEGSNWKT